MENAQVPLTGQRSPGRVGVLRLAATTAVAAALVFVLCWIGTFLSFASPTHAYIGLFTAAETQSIHALVEGGIWSLLFGLVTGSIVASLYNLFAGLDRR